ncbi:chaperone modulator CbpM [Urechidicola croceus]|uniref:MerR family transcriptional regulator n=1 Tax=Urechidicola croceus TaxID=1850246 RepID=A0A1D8P7Z5_9FLAO|nr:chaperone modulator CbpM [Urechidicola croceus]AOW20686.1 hypothetical protein LPB138_08355 [Urechidicola croceus]
METTDFISIERISTHYNIPISFIQNLNEYDLVQFIEVEETVCIYKTEIKEIEKMMRLHYELDINMEGLDAIFNLLNKVDSLKQEVVTLQNKLRLLGDL